MKRVCAVILFAAALCHAAVPTPKEHFGFTPGDDYKLADYNEIISYFEMCQRETSSLQRGMNFDLAEGYSVILMSVHPTKPVCRLAVRVTRQDGEIVLEGEAGCYTARPERTA